jgi:DNA modification methylase
MAGGLMPLIIRVINGDVLAALKRIRTGSIQTVITSPPYLWLRNYGIKGQIGLEKTPAEFIRILVEVFQEIWRVLRDDGVLWLNMGDTYAGSGRGPTGEGGIGDQGKRQGFTRAPNKIAAGFKPGELMGMPWRLAFALSDDGWYLRQDNIWEKPNPMPESIKSRTTRAHEFVFMLTKSGKPQFWIHPTRDGVRKKPSPDYYWKNELTEEIVTEAPEDWTTLTFVNEKGKERKVWKRRNYWTACNYFYDAEAIREDASDSYKNDSRQAGILRQRQNKKSKYPDEGQFEREHKQDIEASHPPGTIPNNLHKQDQTGNPRYTGFNARWKKGKGNRKSFRGGGKYTNHESFDNSGISENETHGNCPNLSLTRNCHDVWKIATQSRPEAHFASFPDALAERCIKAGTSEYGCCPACGAPYSRVIKRQASTMNIRIRDNVKGIIDQKSGLGDGYGASEEEIEDYGPEEMGTAQTIGWRPTCSCNAGPPVPCMTLDPFMGRATVALISRKLGRSSTGIDLNPEYIEISRMNLMGEKKGKKGAAQKPLDTGVVEYQFEVVES